MEQFMGFQDPKENWTKLPHTLIESMRLIETVGEMKVILYILRHTWGFHDDEKKITLDEFENGRKYKDGTRLDEGTGLSIPTISDGLKRAEEHGFIEIETDDHDKGRVKKYYRLRMVSEGERNFTPDPKPLASKPKETLPRSEKDTSEINKEKDCATAQNQPIKSLSEQQQYFGAIATALRIPYQVASNGQAGRIGKLVKRVRKLYTLKEVQDAERYWWHDDWRGKKGDAPSDDSFIQTLEKLRKQRQESEERWKPVA